MSKVVILAAGRGSRMRKETPGVRLEPDQERMAARGLKGLIPIHGHAYLDYVISAAADAGFDDVCLVVAPGRNAIVDHYSRMQPRRVRIRFAVQHEPLGSAHALLAAEPFAAGEPVVVLNSDNYYPAPVLVAVRVLDGNGMAGFRADVLTRRGNVPATRIAAYALAVADGAGTLTRLAEKPDAGLRTRLAPDAWISMTCWRFGPRIFDACRSIGRSVRGELELPDAVSHAIDALGERFRIIPVDEPVIDLSCREDVLTASDWLRGRDVCL